MMRNKLTIEHKKDIILACNQKDITRVYVENIGNDIYGVRILFESGSIQGILANIDKEETEGFIQKVYSRQRDVLIEKYNDLLL